MKTQSKPLAYKVHDVCDCLSVGDVYTTVLDGRLLSMTNVRTGVTVHVYPYIIAHAMCRGAVTVYDTTQSNAMHAPIVGKLCAVLASHYIY